MNWIKKEKLELRCDINLEVNYFEICKFQILKEKLK